MMQMTRRQSLALAGGLAITGARRARAQASRNVMVGGFDVGPGGFQGNFNPLAATAGFQWLNLYYETLVLYDAALENIKGALAASFESNPEKTRFMFHLVPDAKWHDGSAFTSTDVAFTIALAKDAKLGSIFASRLADITDVQTPDAHTAIMVLGKPNGSLPDILTKLMMLPEKALSALPREGLDRNPWWSTSPIGTGPFRFVRYETDQYVELKANSAYRAGKPKLDGVINRYFKNSAGAVAALRSGEIQFSYVESDEAAGFANDPKFHVIDGNSWVMNYIGFNARAGMWSDVRVRRALLQAINRDAIIKAIFKGAADPALSIYTAGNVTPKDLDPYPYDPAHAKLLLQQAGWDKINGSKPLPMLSYYNTPLVTNVMTAIQAMLGQVGIMVTPRQVDVATYNGIVYGQNNDAQFPLVYAGAQDGPEPGIANIYINSKQAPPAGANIMHADVPDLDAALNAALAEPDASKRPARFQQVARVFNTELPWAPLWVGKRYGVLSADIHNFVWTPAPSGGGYEQNAVAWSFS